VKLSSLPHSVFQSARHFQSDLKTEYSQRNLQRKSWIAGKLATQMAPSGDDPIFQEGIRDEVAADEMLQCHRVAYGLAPEKKPLM
jgi:hypothetical protein